MNLDLIFGDGSPFDLKDDFVTLRRHVPLGLMHSTTTAVISAGKTMSGLILLTHRQVSGRIEEDHEQSRRQAVVGLTAISSDACQCLRGERG